MNPAEAIAIVLVHFFVPRCGEIRGELSTDHSTGQPQSPRVEDMATLPKVPMP